MASFLRLLLHLLAVAAACVCFRAYGLDTPDFCFNNMTLNVPKSDPRTRTCTNLHLCRPGFFRMGGSWLAVQQPLVRRLLFCSRPVGFACVCVVVCLVSGSWSGVCFGFVRTPSAGGCALLTRGVVGSLDSLDACRPSQQQAMHVVSVHYVACPQAELACAAPGVLRMPPAWSSAVLMLLCVVSAQQDTAGLLCLP
jgi:hypothetical protein